MQESNYNLGTRPSEGEMYSAGIAYVAIPSDVDRDKYIQECYKTSTVSIYSEHNGWTNRVPIDRLILGFIEFPADVNQLGSAVSFILEPLHKKPIIVGLHNTNDELSDLQEHQFSFKRVLNGNTVEITGSPDGKYIGITVDSDQAGEVSLNVKSRDKSGKVNIDVDGDVNIIAANNTHIKQSNQFQVATINPDDAGELAVMEQTSNSHTFFDDEHNVNTGKFDINNGKEPFVLGKVFKDLFDEFIDELGRTTVTTSLGQMPILNKAQVIAFKNRTESILSKIGFIDK